MLTVYNSKTFQELVDRINKLTEETPRLWGKMNVSQMMAHCAEGIRAAMGEIKIKRNLFSILFGRFFKGMLTGKMKMGKNSPTAPEFLVTESKDFQIEKEKLIALLYKMHEGGEAGASTHPHGFFGKMTPSEWGQGQYYHLDHHLRQFGV